MAIPVKTTRRDFITNTLAAGTLMAVGGRARAGTDKNSTIRLGMVGCGWRGGQLTKAFKGTKGATLVAICDADEVRMGELAAEHSDLTLARYTDMRKLFESPDIDAVIIATCNHWHCLAAIWALEAGKHVYVEKPLAHTHWEGIQLVNAVKRYGKICQVGTQQRSDPMQQSIREFLHEERALGEIKSVAVHRFGGRKSIGKLSKPLTIPKSVDFDLWSGPAEVQDIYRPELHYDWHWDWNTGSGEMGNWGVHLVDDVRNNIFQDKVAFPKSVTGVGGRYVWDDAGNTPNLQFALLDTGSIPVLIGVCNVNAAPDASRPPNVPGYGSGYVAYCEGGRFEGKRGEATAYDSDGKVIRQFDGGGGNHQQNFIDCIRNNSPAQLITPVEMGHQSTAWCNLANVATRFTAEQDSVSGEASYAFADDLPVAEELRLGTELLQEYGLGEEAQRFQFGPVLHFDGGSQQFAGDNASVANKYLRRKYRSEFAVPEVV